ncbi:MAG: hypothetical protein ACLTUC_11700 [Anaerobutyricum soehngenii]
MPYRLIYRSFRLMKIGESIDVASQKENTDKRKYVILKYKYVGKKPLEDSNEKRTIRG